MRRLLSCLTTALPFAFLAGCGGEAAPGRPDTGHVRADADGPGSATPQDGAPDVRIDAAPEKRCATVPAGGACTPTSWVGTWQLSLTLVPPRPGMCSGSSVIRPEPTRSLAVDLTTSDGQVCVASGDWQTLQASSDGCALTVSTTTDWKNPSEYGSETVTVRLHTTAGQTTAEYNDSERGFFSCDRTWAGTAQQGTADGGARDDARLGD